MENNSQISKIKHVYCFQIKLQYNAKEASSSAFITALNIGLELFEIDNPSVLADDQEFK